jgi:hypothetical protein
MYETQPTPLSWLRQITDALQWPVIVTAAFWLGRYIHALEERITKAESNVSAIVERHLPAIHNALSEIRGLLQSRR